MNNNPSAISTVIGGDNTLASPISTEVLQSVANSIAMVVAVSMGGIILYFIYKYWIKS